MFMGPWGTRKPTVMTIWALGLMPELAAFFLEEGGGHWKNQFRVCEAPLPVAIKGVLAPEPGNV